MLIIGNWKMAPEKKEQAITLSKKLNVLIKKYKSTDFVFCPPYIYLEGIKKQVKNLTLGAQKVSTSFEVANTSAISATMVKNIGAEYCIAGHSEVRAMGETDEMINQEILNLLEKKVKPIFCIGEIKRDTQGWYLSSIKDQIQKGLAGVTTAQLKNVVIAYEPVWAIGKNAEREATPVESMEMVIFIKKIIADLYDEKSSKNITILYGGSVNENNAKSFVTAGGANGLLIGRVSLDIKKFEILLKSIK